MAAAAEISAPYYELAKQNLGRDIWDEDLESILDEEMEREDELDDEIELNAVLDDEEIGAAREPVKIRLSQFSEFAIRLPIAGRIQPFRFTGRPYLPTIYDTSARSVLLKCSRQVEKSEAEDTEVLMDDGTVKKIKEVGVGERVVGLASPAATGLGTITWKSRRYKKDCVRIRTRLGHVSTMAKTHPMRTWGSWTPAGELVVGDRLASVRSGGVFTDTADHSDALVIIAAAMIADGDCRYTPTFTQNYGVLLELMIDSCLKEGVYFREDELETGKGCKLNFVQNEDGSRNRMRDLLERWGLYGATSKSTFLPNWVFQLSERQTALFLNVLWAGDGHAKLNESSYSLEYCSISKRLVEGVQRLLWKFGIPSNVKRWKPTLYKGTEKWAYRLRVLTREGVETFVDKIGAFGKTEDLPRLIVKKNNNRDTLPITISDDIKALNRSREGYQRRGRFVPQPSLRSCGLNEKLSYPLSKEKLKRYVRFFRSDRRFDQELVDQLAAHLNSDLFWDEIVEIEDVGPQWCYDIAVSDTESFVGDGLITHNSTMLGNKSLGWATIIPGFNVLYVSSSATQAQVFSVDRIKEPIGNSKVLQQMFDPREQSVFSKRAKNGSMIRMRYAYLNADRTRGIPSDATLIDEVQHIITENISIIEQCAFHSPFKWRRYSGTPLSLDNTIELLWENHSTQNEWVVPCRACGADKKPHTWNWNILGPENIGKHGLVCARCKNPIIAADPDAHWRAIQPITEQNIERVTFQGFRVTQLMVPWVKWKEDILEKREEYGDAQFHNEVCGLSFDSGLKPITKAQLMRCSREEVDMSRLEYNAKKCKGGVYAGIDWGQDTNNSYTVLVLGGYYPHGFQIFFAHRFIGIDKDFDIQKAKIEELLGNVGFRMLGADYGGGFGRNDHLIKCFGHEKVARYQYANDPKSKIVWNLQKYRFMLHRSEIMTDIFTALKERKIWLPNWNQFDDPYGKDIRNIFSEYNVRRMMIQYMNKQGKPDDTFHAILYCILASMLVRPRFDIILPTKEGAVDFNRPGVHS